MTKPSRPVTRCVSCGARFRPARADARYCSGACRQRAHRARADIGDVDRSIADARRLYWDLIRQKAEAHGITVSQVVTDESQFVDEDGRVFIRGEHVGTTKPHRLGWAAWGLEAAGPPFSPSTPWLHERHIADVENRDSGCRDHSVTSKPPEVPGNRS